MARLTLLLKNRRDVFREDGRLRRLVEPRPVAAVARNPASAMTLAHQGYAGTP